MSDIERLQARKIDTNEGRFSATSPGPSMLTEAELTDLWGRIWDGATSQTDGQGRRRHTAGIKWLLEAYGVTVRSGAGPHGPVRHAALTRLESMGAIERIGGGATSRTRSLWVADPNDEAS